MSTTDKGPALTVQEVADHYKLSTETIYRWLKNKGLPHFRLPNNDIRMWTAEVEAFMAGGPTDEVDEVVEGSEA